MQVDQLSASQVLRALGRRRGIPKLMLLQRLQKLLEELDCADHGLVLQLRSLMIGSPLDQPALEWVLVQTLGTDGQGSHDDGAQEVCNNQSSPLLALLVANLLATCGDPRGPRKLLHLHSAHVVQGFCSEALCEPLLMVVRGLSHPALTVDEIAACHTAGALAAEANNDRRFVSFIYSLTSCHWAEQPKQQIVLAWDSLFSTFVAGDKPEEEASMLMDALKTMLLKPPHKQLCRTPEAVVAILVNGAGRTNLEDAHAIKVRVQATLIALGCQCNSRRLPFEQQCEIGLKLLDMGRGNDQFLAYYNHVCSDRSGAGFLRSIHNWMHLDSNSSPRREARWEAASDWARGFFSASSQ